MRSPAAPRSRERKRPAAALRRAPAHDRRTLRRASLRPPRRAAKKDESDATPRALWARSVSAFGRQVSDAPAHELHQHRIGLELVAQRFLHELELFGAELSDKVVDGLVHAVIEILNDVDLTALEAAERFARSDAGRRRGVFCRAGFSDFEGLSSRIGRPGAIDPGRTRGSSRAGGFADSVDTHDSNSSGCCRSRS